MTPITVALLEDHVCFRESLRVALEVSGHFKVVGEAASARDAVPMIEAARPQVIAVDLMLQDTDGIATIRELGRRGLQTRALLLARLGHPLFIVDAFAAGAFGYVLKDDTLVTIMEGLKTVAAGQRFVSPKLAGFEERAAPHLHMTDGLDRLSRREREVFTRMLEGLTAKEIARALYVSVKTVQSHQLQINRKLGVRSPAQFAKLTAEAGLLTG